MPYPLRLVACSALLVAAALPAVAATYYVATTGSDTAAGSSEAPWRTLQKAANSAVAGDTVWIRGGTYRETVTFANSGTATAPIVFQNSPGETVTVTGLDEITPGASGTGTWTQHSTNVWKIQLTSSHGFGAGSLGRNQVVVDGAMQQEARWPNSTTIDDFVRTNLATADNGTVDVTSRDASGFFNCSYTDSDVAAFATDAWKGALMCMALGRQWVSAAGYVSGNSGSTLSFRYKYSNAADPNDRPSAGDPYYLVGRLIALDAANEFFFDDAGVDGTSFVLYLYKSGGVAPAAGSVQMRKRDLALNFGTRSYVTVTGLRIFAGRVVSATGSSNLILDRLSVEYGGHRLDLTPGGAYPNSVQLVGSNHTFRHGLVSYSTGDGLTCDSASTNLLVENSVFFNHLSSGVNTAGSRTPLVQRNTTFNAASVPLRYNARAGRFLYNHAYNAGQGCVDVGIINAFASGDAEGTEVAYNWAHDNYAPLDRTRGWNGGTAIRLDCGGSPIASFNVVFHHNVTWNCSQPEQMVFWGVTSTQLQATNGQTTVSTNNRAYNNTVQGNLIFAGGGSANTEQVYGTGGIIRNNLIGGTFANGNVLATGATISDNLFGTATQVTTATNNTVAAWTFVPPLDLTFSIPATATATDRGAVIAPYTDGFKGSAPDLGAYESGVTPLWVAGAEVLAEQVAGLTPGYTTVAGAGRVTISGLPVGRGLGTNAKIRIGSATSTSFRPTLDMTTHRLTATFVIDLTGLGGVQTVQLANDGTTYTVLTAALTLPGSQTTTAPVITTQPAAVTATAGQAVTLSAAASGSPTATFQWRKNGTAIAGATSATLTFASVLTSDAGTYTVALTNSAGTTVSDPAVLTVTVPNPGRLINLSIRGNAGAGAQTLIVGLVIGGTGTTGSKPMLIRGAGPALAAYGVTNFLVDPLLSVYNASSVVVASNDNWSGDAQVAALAAQVAAFPYPSTTSRDAGLVTQQPGGSYTVQVTGVGNAVGNALGEIYEATAAEAFTTVLPRLINASARAQVGTGADILIAGFAVGGATAKTVLIRAIGPGLTSHGVTGVLADPRLELYNGSTLLQTNDNWGGTATLTSTFNAVGAFAIDAASRDSALLATLQPGTYTAQVSGVSNTTGVALVEVYEVP